MSSSPPSITPYPNPNGSHQSPTSPIFASSPHSLTSPSPFSQAHSQGQSQSPSQVQVLVPNSNNSKVTRHQSLNLKKRGGVTGRGVFTPDGAEEVPELPRGYYNNSEEDLNRQSHSALRRQSENLIISSPFLDAPESQAHSRSRSGTGPPSLSIDTALRSPTSPLGGMRSPWSMTEEEKVSLSRRASQSGSRRGSEGVGVVGGEDIESGGSVNANRGGSVQRKMSLLEKGLERLQIPDNPASKPLSPPGLSKPLTSASTVTPSTAHPFASPAPKTGSTGSSVTPTNRKTSLLPPLLTNHDVLAGMVSGRGAGGEGMGKSESGESEGDGGVVVGKKERNATNQSENLPALSTQNLLKGPQSAAPYVPPIGHSHKILRRTSSSNIRTASGDNSLLEEREFLLSRGGGMFSAAPGLGSHSFRNQKERLFGSLKGDEVMMESPSSLSSPWASKSNPIGTPTSPNPEQTLQAFQALQHQQQQILQQIQVNREMMDRIAASANVGSTSGVGVGVNVSVGGSTNFTPTSNAAPAFTNVFNPPTSYPNLPFVTPPVPPTLPNGMTLPPPPTINAFSTQGMMISPISAPSPINQGYRPPFGYGSGNGGVQGRGSGGGGGSFGWETQKLIEEKGYNPKGFELRPKKARFFVIKSYTEEDVHKSLKYEIWASTDLGNKRLDKAFKESSSNGPIYLFFSVNASGHFCGVAQMMTAVDYSTSSTVWAQDKWKGVFKVKWIYVKDVPLSALRQIKLENTHEKKPVTSSRDTQEVPYDAGLEVLRIIAGYHSNTTLVQDYSFYEQKEMDRVQREQYLQQQQQQQSSPMPSGGVLAQDSVSPTPQANQKTLNTAKGRRLFS